MQFQHTIKMVLNQTKCQTRRLVKPRERYDDRSVFGLPPAVFTVSNKDEPAPRVKWYVGQTLAVQPGRTAKGIACIRITGIRCEDVRNISKADAKAEGFRDRLHFWQTWWQMHDKVYTNWKDPMTAPLISERPAELYTAWVLTFELVAPDTGAQEA